LKQAQIAVLDTGGQYCHLIARKVRELGVSSDVFPSDVDLEKVCGARGIIISGGPHSVYDESSPKVQQAVLTAGIPVLGICYGQQLLAHQLGGTVQPGNKGEFGMAYLDLLDTESATPESQILRGVRDHQRIWMSHRDSVVATPPGFRVLASTATCNIAAMEDSVRHLYGVQFHPEVVHTTEGVRILNNFVFDVCACEKDWNAGERVALVEEQIRQCVGNRRVFFFVSGGVDSTVAFTLCLRALGSDRVHGVYVDTGLMREGETGFVEQTFERLGHGTVEIEHAQAEFLTPLAAAGDPEQKRHIIGEQFLKVQERIIESRGLLAGGWLLGQGTIYPDTIESGGTARAATIKTHHNRVPGIQKLMDEGRIVEPLADFYKDEVRAIGRQLGLPDRLLDRHPFPGPGLAIRCLCAQEDQPVRRVPEGWMIPVRSVGVQGDSRSYAPVLAIEAFPSVSAKLQDEATELVNRMRGVNRVIAAAAVREPLGRQRVFASSLTETRVNLLRRADAIVRELCDASGFDAKVWQFPVILIPLGAGASHDSVVLRPVQSVDGMTADSVAMPDDLLNEICSRLMAMPEIAGVFYDLTHKPPGTIEWE
jgi:GMP synthase (glutamine-hydrolysing)